MAEASAPAAKRRLTGKRQNLNMTEGSISKMLILFALPLLAGNLFQQLYNMVDTWVIGQTGQTGAYAAVGTVAPIINIFIGLAGGIANGASVVIAQYYGARDRDAVRRATHTAFLLMTVLGVAFTLLGMGLAPLMLRLMLGSDGSAGIVSFATEYLTIYFSGMLSMLIYNAGAGILRAIGDSRHPFYYLIVSAVLNTVLDVVFVFGFSMGVAGVAYATVIAQTASAVLVVCALFRTKTDVKLDLHAMRTDGKMLKKIVRMGIPAGIQMALTSFSNVFVQSYVGGVNNLAQEAALGGWTTYSKLDQLLMLPIQTIGLATSTFVGQNLGNGQTARARRGVLVAYGMATGITAVAMIPLIVFAGPLASFFNADPAVVACSEILLHYLTPFYLFCCVNQIFSNGLRGAGNSTAPMVIMLASFVGFRQIYLFVVSNFISNELLPITFSYPAGWAVCALTTILYYRFYRFRPRGLVED